jgi:hypothetical protein
VNERRVSIALGDGDMFRAEKGELVFPVETGRRNPVFVSQ